MAFWGGESFWTSAIGFFQQEGERKVVSRRGGKAFSFWQEGEGLLLLLSCRLGMFLSLGREGWLLLVGESGDCRGILYPFLFGFSFRFPFHFHSFYYCLACGSCSGREGESLWSEGTAVGSFSLPLSSSFFLLILHLILFLGRVLFVLHSSLPGRCLESRDEGMDPLESWQRNGEGAVDDFALLVEEEPLLGLASHALVGHRVLAPDAPAVEFLFLQ